MLNKINISPDKQKLIVYLINYRQAIEDLNRAIEIKPNYADAYFNRGVAYAKFGNKDLAVNDIKMAEKLGDERAKNLLKSQGISW